MSSNQNQNSLIHHQRGGDTDKGSINMNLAASMNNLFSNKFKNGIANHPHPGSAHNLISNDNTLNSSYFSMEKNKAKREKPKDKDRNPR